MSALMIATLPVHPVEDNFCRVTCSEDKEVLQMKRSEVLHVEQFNSHPVRFVRSPATEIDIPWVVAADALAAIGLPKRGFGDVLRGMREAVETHTVALDGEVVNIVPMWVLSEIQGYFGFPDYSAGKATMNAMKAAYPDMPPKERAAAAISAPSFSPLDIEGDSQ